MEFPRREARSLSLAQSPLSPASLLDVHRRTALSASGNGGGLFYFSSGSKLLFIYPLDTAADLCPLFLQDVIKDICILGPRLYS